MWKTPDETKKSLEFCYSSVEPIMRCEQCPYYGSVVCKMHLHTDSLVLIQQLQAQNSEKDARIRQLESDKQQFEGMLHHMNQLRDAAAGRALQMEERVHQLEAERDALTKDLETFIVVCDCCKNADKSTEERPCNHCKHIFKGRKSCFEWRGVTKEDSDA